MTLTRDQKEQALAATRAAFDRRGGISVIRAEMDEFHKLNLRLAAAYPELQDKHPDQWICMDKEGVVATGGSLEEIMETVHRMNFDMSEVIFEYISADDNVVIV